MQTASARLMTQPTASDRYQREAARLREKAVATQDPTIRVELLAMARQYDVLAESIEDRETDQND
jgi:hypothetical protein